MSDSYTQTVMSLGPLIETCDPHQHKFIKLPDHPRDANGHSMCPYCMAKGIEFRNQQIKELLDQKDQKLDHKAAEYKKIVEEAVAQIYMKEPDHNKINEKFQTFLLERGLWITSQRSPPHRRDLYPGGSPRPAPAAQNNGSYWWGPHSVIVWKDES